MIDRRLSSHRLGLAFATLTLLTGPATYGQASSDKPATPPATTPATAPATTPAAPAAPAAEALPAAETLCKRHVEAVGGEAAVKAITRLTTKGVFEVPASGIKAPIATYMSDPQLLLTEMELPGYGSVRTGYNGSVGWSIDSSRGPRILAGKELEQIKRDADARRDLTLLKDYDEVKVIGLVEFGGAPSYEVRCKGPNGDMTYFFAKDSGLVRGFKMATETALGTVDVETIFLDYKAFDGPGGAVKIPVKSEITMLKQKQVLTLESVSFDAIEATRFDLPKEIQALAQQGAPAKPATPEPPAPKADPAAPPPPAQPKADEKPAGEPKKTAIS